MSQVRDQGAPSEYEVKRLRFSRSASACRLKPVVTPESRHRGPAPTSEFAAGDGYKVCWSREHEVDLIGVEASRELLKLERTTHRANPSIG